jgi:hypothetical protein
MKHIFPIVLFIFLLIVSFLAQNSFFTKASPTAYAKDLFVGVDVAYYNLTEFKAEVDEVSAYTNLIVIGTTRTTYNATLLDETCQYLYDKGLSFIIYGQTIRANQTQWFQNANAKWGDHFLGIYSAADEFGGKQLDLYRYRAVWQADNYTDAANQYVANLTANLKRITRNFNTTVTFPMFISDYALYWFDYKAGLNTVFAEFGWNYSRQLNVASCRGAATVQNKDWGAMITWTYTNPPYVESGQQLLDDMKLAYDNGAKYIIVFDSNANYTQSILQPEHLQAMQQFWQYVQANPRPSDPPGSRVAFVLPNDYGHGFRGPNDKIWGLWQADNFATQLCETLNSALKQYGSKLDIIYDDPAFPNYTDIYDTTLFWNGTASASAASTVTSTLSSGTTGLSPTYIMAIVATDAAIIFIFPITFEYRRRGKQETTLLENEHPIYNPKPPFPSKKSISAAPYGQPEKYGHQFPMRPTENIRYVQPRTYSQQMPKTPTVVSKYDQPARYFQQSYSTKNCRHCKQTVREDLNVCPHCFKTLK